jgi:hypothetical protein
MKHQYIEEHQVVDRYLLGKLSVEEQIRFEDHLIGCRQCVDWLETSERMRIALRTVATEEAGRLGADRRRGQLIRPRRLNRGRLAAGLAGGILLIGLLVSWPLVGWIYARRDLAQVRRALTERQRESETREQADRDLVQELRTRELQLSAQLEKARQERRQLVPKMESAGGLQADVPVFALSMGRGGGSGQSQPVNRIVFPPSSQLFILLLEFEPDPDLRSYRAAISTADGRTRERLAVSLKTSLFKPNNYLLTLEGVTAQGNHVLVAQYMFLVFAR